MVQLVVKFKKNKLMNNYKDWESIFDSTLLQSILKLGTPRGMNQKLSNAKN